MNLKTATIGLATAASTTLGANAQKLEKTALEQGKKIVNTEFVNKAIEKTMPKTFIVTPGQLLEEALGGHITKNPRNWGGIKGYCTETLAKMFRIDVAAAKTKNAFVYDPPCMLKVSKEISKKNEHSIELLQLLRESIKELGVK